MIATPRMLLLPTLVLVLALTAGQARAADGEQAPGVTLTPCTFAGSDETLQCGTVTVFENREAGSGRTIDLNVVVAPALGEPVAPDPVFFFQGGPGAAAAAYPAAMADAMRGLRAHRALVMVDQRGTGGSHPLDCPVPGGPDDIQGNFDDYMPPAVLRTCRETLSRDADLTQYTTAIAMDDIDEVRRRLGYRQINLVGGSYGTRAIQVYLRRHGEHARTAVLTGSAAMDQHLPLNHARDGQRSVELVLAACAAEEACHQAFPRVGEELRQVVARLEKTPATATIPHPESGEPVTVEIDRAAFGEGLRLMTYTAATAAAVPLMIHQVYQGETTLPGRLILRSQMGLRGAIHFGMHLSVVCAEDAPFFTAADAAAADADTFLGDFRTRQILDGCALWPRAAIPAGYHHPVSAGVPTLLLTGELDPVTPPRWAARVDAHLPRSRNVVIAHGHHGFGGLSDPDCVSRITDDFIARGTLEGLDTSCADTLRRPPFITDPAEVEAFLDPSG